MSNIVPKVPTFLNLFVHSVEILKNPMNFLNKRVK